MSLLTRCIFTPVSTGTGDFVVDAAVAGYLAPVDAGAINATIYEYAAEVRDGSGVVTDWEVGSGAYTTGDTTLARTTIRFSSNSNAAVDFASVPNVMITGLTLSGQTVTANLPVLDLAQTWNNAGVAFTGLKFNATSTASAAASALIDMRVGGTTQFVVGKDGVGYFGSAANLAMIRWGGEGGVGANARGINAGNGALVFTSNGGVGWFDSGGDGDSLDLKPTTGWIGWNAETTLSRDAANIIAQRNIVAGTTAQTFRVYNTFTDASNYERGIFDWTSSSNVLTIGTQSAGTGSFRNLRLIAGASSVGKLILGASGGDVAFELTGVEVLTISGSKNITPSNNGTWGLGSVSIDWGKIYLSNTASVIGWSSSAGSGVQDTGISKVAPKVVGFGNATGQDVAGWLQWGGQKRVTGDFSSATDATFTDVTGLSVNLQAGRTYSFQAVLFTTSNVAAGIKVNLDGDGTTSATDIIYEGETTSGAAVAVQTRASALATTVGAITAVTAARVDIWGTITVNAAGAFKVRFGQNVSNATASKVLRGSYFIVQDMP